MHQDSTFFAAQFRLPTCRPPTYATKHALARQAQTWQSPSETDSAEQGLVASCLYEARLCRKHGADDDTLPTAPLPPLNIDLDRHLSSKLADTR